MRKLALWAKYHLWYARISVIFLHLLLGLLAYILSNLVTVTADTQEGLLYGAVLLFLVLLPVYGLKKTFLYRKVCDFLIALCSFVVLFCFNSKYYNPSGLYQNTYATSTSDVKPKRKLPTAEEVLASLKYRDKSTLTRKEKRVLKQEFKKQLKIYVIQKIKGKKEDSNKTLYIILTIIGALGVLALVASISCNLSCNGMESAAAVVVILGIIGVALGAYFIIRRISRGPRKIPDSP